MNDHDGPEIVVAKNDGEYYTGNLTVNGRGGVRVSREYADWGVDVKIFETPEAALEWLKKPGIAVAV